VRIARYITDDIETVGIVVDDDRVVDIEALGPDIPTDVVGLLQAGAPMWARIAGLAAAQTGRPLATVQLKAPIQPSKFLAVGMNSEDHAREIMDAPRSPEVIAVLQASQHLKAAFPDPRYPTIFNKQTTSVTGPGDPIWIPCDSTQVDYEGEIAIVIGRRVRRADEAEARAAIAGWTVTNDVSVRDWQWDTSQMWLGKSFDTHGPIGPWIVTADEFDADAAVIKTWVNGELRQDGRLADQILSPAKIVSLISQVCSLEPGDLIATGTPGGIGAVTGRYLVPGDRVRIEVTGIGEICNAVVDEPQGVEDSAESAAAAA
jgi:2-keto-4-pentenoate hydratase/2-oxohepta-3-ene-1,7-dioic acid hydratase in catechol pathway